MFISQALLPAQLQQIDEDFLDWSFGDFNHVFLKFPDFVLRQGFGDAHGEDVVTLFRTDDLQIRNQGFQDFAFSAQEPEVVFDVLDRERFKQPAFVQEKDFVEQGFDFVNFVRPDNQSAGITGVVGIDEIEEIVAVLQVDSVQNGPEDCDVRPGSKAEDSSQKNPFVFLEASESSPGSYVEMLAEFKSVGVVPFGVEKGHQAENVFHPEMPREGCRFGNVAEALVHPHVAIEFFPVEPNGPGVRTDLGGKNLQQFVAPGVIPSDHCVYLIVQEIEGEIAHQGFPLDFLRNVLANQNGHNSSLHT